MPSLTKIGIITRAAVLGKVRELLTETVMLISRIAAFADTQMPGSSTGPFLNAKALRPGFFAP